MERGRTALISCRWVDLDLWRPSGARCGDWKDCGMGEVEFALGSSKQLGHSEHGLSAKWQPHEDIPAARSELGG